MPYTIIDAIKDEILLLDDMINWAKRNKNALIENMYTVQQSSLRHLVERTQGYDFKLSTDKDGKQFVGKSMSNRKTLEEEYPSLKKAAEEYDIVKTLVENS